MRVISLSRLKQFWARHADAEKELRKWYLLTDSASWRTPADVKQTFGVRVDFVQVGGGSNTVAVFDVTNNKYQLVAAIHYDHPRLFVLRVMAHEEYDKS